MKIYILLTLISSLLFSKVTVAKQIEQFSIKDQFEQTHKLEKDTKKIIFAFSKSSGNKVRNFLSKQSLNYLTSKEILFVLDVSQMSLIRRWFVLDDLEKHKYSILLLEDEKISQNFIDEKRTDKVMVVSLSNLKVIGIDYLDTIDDLQNIIENN